MVTILITIAVLTVLILITLKMGLSKKEAVPAEDGREPLIHVSGVYSVLRKSPREDLAALRPTEGAIQKYLDGIDEDINGRSIRSMERADLRKHWKAQMEANLQGIENGDKKGVAFYYYDFPILKCSVCDHFITKGNFVTREEIFKNPQIIPPFHLGCTCILTAHHGSDTHVRETTVTGMLPFFSDETPPPLPEWTDVITLSANAGVNK
ncbi:MAG: hypothetical protein LBC70_08485 [Chitinispirillales bacterium]|jgi:hypothetical protein|nr:hypothetical protein [Chitinispirillales bacterium]